jgi:glycosyltransferase involved in cell wall biosynthesis
LATAVIHALATSRRVSSASLERVKHEFSVAACAERYLAVYEAALSSSR